jgi:CRISPR-associated protein Csb2
MPLILSLRFPTERYVAASTTNRDELEWPPHPARLMLGLLATHYRSGGPPEERAALQWLCEQGAPDLYLPPEDRCTPETLSGVFVPQNPTEAKSIQHPRKARTFPSLLLPEDQAFILLHWPDAEPDSSIRACLDGLLRGLARFGHSSSLVAGEITDSIPRGEWRHLRPVSPDDPAPADCRLRIPWSGLLTSAEEVYEAAERENELIAALERRDRAEERGRPLTKFEASSRGRYDPRHVTAGYREKLPESPISSPWENTLFVFQRDGGDRLGLSSTWQLTATLHQTMLDRWCRRYPDTPVPSWISGHRAGEGKTAPSSDCHLAIIPMANLDHAHADGRLLGIGIGFPRADRIGLDRQQLRLQWRKMLVALLDEGRLELSPKDRAWTFALVPDDGSSGRTALRSATWTRPAKVWHSVTPVILDRHPKPSFEKNPEAWEESCRAIIADACRRTGLPVPEKILVSPYSPVLGAPPAPAFIAPASRPGRPARFHLHACLWFAEEITGPVLLGAGRFRGYGLFKPAHSTPELP